MQCPLDGTGLVISERNGIEIDYCPKCRGVWLDRGELDKIVERTVPTVAEPKYSHRDQEPRPYKKKRESFLSDLFDF